MSEVAIRSAATVMLVRDDPDVHVFVLRRTPNAVFGPGATVFPGGAVDPADDDAVPYVVGMDEHAAASELGITEGGLARRVAAVRECFEEAGILLARDARTRTAAAPSSEWRDALNSGQATMAEVLGTEGLVIDAGDLRVFSHWLTPLGAPRRYDTWFFVARAPHGQDGVHDDNELVASEWVRPVDALERGARGEIELITPTLRSLQVLSRYARVDDLFGALDQVEHDDEGRLVVAPEASGERVLLPGDERRSPATWTIPLPDIDFRTELQFLSEPAR